MIACALLSACSFKSNETDGMKMASNQEIRMYMPFTSPIDPARIRTMPDMVLSFALGGTLVEWSKSKDIVSAVMGRWEVIGSKTFRFHLRKNAKWSNGDSITSSDVKRSFERAIKDYPKDLRSLSKILEKIEPHSETAIDFKLKVNASESNLLGKLTEANYCVIKIDSEGKIDLSQTAGPFFVKKTDKEEIVLAANPHWHRFDSGMSKQITIRWPKDITDLHQVLLEEDWPNLIEFSSLISSDLLKAYQEKGYSLWERSIDRIYTFTPGKQGELKDRLDLMQFLASSLDRERLTQNLSGYQFADQIFSDGYELFDPELSFNKKPISLPKKYQSRPLNILMARLALPKEMESNLIAAIERATGRKPNIIKITDYMKQLREGDYDLYAGWVGLADPDIEGVMSFYIEGDAAPITNEGADYIARLDQARKASSGVEKINLMRSILSDATQSGRIVPLFHFSTIGIAKPGVDLSQISKTDEAVTLSEIRFKK